MSIAILEINNLHVQIDNRFDVVNGLSFSVRPGETVCLVGESGCGKSISALSVLRLLPSAARVTAGEIQFNGINLLNLKEKELRRIRGNDIAMVFQEPMSSLNPLRTIGFQIAEVMMLHKGLSRTAAWDRAAELLEVVHLSDVRKRLDDYPHQLSGGMRQRVMLAMALACEPAVILADEPTTALDVTIQAQITNLLAEMQNKFGTAIMLITHDMGLVAENADRVVVMYAGRKVEEATVEEFFKHPMHPYSRGLLGSLPQLGMINSDRQGRLREIPGTVPALHDLPSGCPFSTRCDYADEICREQFPPYDTVGTEHILACWHPQGMEGGEPMMTACAHDQRVEEIGAKPLALRVRNLKKYFPIRSGVFARTTGYVRAVDGISFDLPVGETLGFVGESGCGKSTAGKTILRLLSPTAGSIELGGHDITTLGEYALRPLRREMQMVFQDPYASLNPRMTIGAIVTEPLVTHGIASGDELIDRVSTLFAKVGLRPEQMTGYPHQFSGGQRQRVAIARALAVEPNLIICDEPVSALDISIQAQIINLMMDIQASLSLSYLFISHDLAVVELIADRIAVMYLGVIVEIGAKEEIIRNPRHPYTKALLSAVPMPDPWRKNRVNIVLTGDVPSSSNPPSGCRFHSRCHLAEEWCRVEVPELESSPSGHAVACHFCDRH